MPQEKHICMLAAENDVIPGAKVGGIGDVLRDIPAALASTGATVTVIIPAYGTFHTLSGSHCLQAVTVPFMGQNETVYVYEVFRERDPGVRYVVLHHAFFGVCGSGRVYCDDGSDSPFATDASKFALFNIAALQAIKDKVFGTIDVLHLHDWHTGYSAILRAFDPNFSELQHVPCVFSIHNLALQGVRPFSGHESSLRSWYPHLHVDEHHIADPRWPNCVNPMAAGIRLADKVHTVSPTYALEILKPNSTEQGFHGGEGLEYDLQQAFNNDKLVGIINGIDYNTPVTPRTEWHNMMNTIGNTILSWLGEAKTIRAADYLAHQRSQQWLSNNRPQHVLTSVGRLTDQKMTLLVRPTGKGTLVLDELLISLKGKGVFILLGSGDAEIEAICQRCAARHSNFLYLNRYAQTLADSIFANGDLFIMPSSFEPCGISQMLAMRQGQPCLVHAVGGLIDTVINNIDGFHFTGDGYEQQTEAMLQQVDSILKLRETNPTSYRSISQAAKDKRFYWRASAESYQTKLYQ